MGAGGADGDAATGGGRGGTDAPSASCSALFLADWSSIICVSSDLIRSKYDVSHVPSATGRCNPPCPNDCTDAALGSPLPEQKLHWHSVRPQ